MRTKATTVLSLFMLILLNPASCNMTDSSPTNHSTALLNLSVTSQPPQGLTGNTMNESTYTHATAATKQENATHPSASTSPAPPPTAPNSRTWLVLSLIAIVVLMVFVGCFHSMRKHQSGETSSAGQFMMDMRERLRTMISNLENQLGVRLWPGAKRGRTDDVEESQVEEERQEGHDGGECASVGGSNEDKEEDKGEDKEEDKQEDSETSDDYSSMEGDDLRERALTRQKEEERSQSENKDEEDTGSASDGDHNDEEEKNEGSEKMALVSSPQEEDENTNVTAL